MIHYRTLTKDDFPDIYLTMDEAFSDYYVEVDMDRESYKRKFELEGVAFEHSVGAFDSDRLVGTTMNGIGYENDPSTVYDSGTGVIPEYRRMGISSGMFDFILRHLSENGFRQYLLEVIIENRAALALYKGIGFENRREFAIYRTVDPLSVAESSGDKSKGIKIREIDKPDWNLLREFWGVNPSWQNSIDWVKRAKLINYRADVLGLFESGILRGYGVISPESGKISQLAVDPEYRGRGFGKRMVGELNERSEKPLIMTNIDTRAVDLIAFFEKLGFVKTVGQYEMMLKL